MICRRAMTSNIRLLAQCQRSPFRRFSFSSSASPSSDVLRIVSISSVAPIETAESVDLSEGEELSDEYRIDVHVPNAGDSPRRRCPRRNRRRSRSMSLPRKKAAVHPIVTPTMSYNSPVPKTRIERVFKDGIHSPAINVVSDESSSEDPASSSDERRSYRSTHSNMSSRARGCRIRRLQEQAGIVKRRRSRSLEPPLNRRQKDIAIVTDPSIMHIFRACQEYGPDEASL